VVSEAMARALWKSDDPLGKCFRVGSDTLPCTTVVGVAENMKMGDITEEDGFAYYLPISQYYTELGDAPMTALFVRVRGHPDDFVETIRARLQSILPGPAYVQVIPMHEIIDPTMRPWSAGATMFLGFGALALALATIGLYAVIAFAVVQRQQEFGVRLALGARGADLLRMVVGEGARVTLGGVTIGTAVALAAAPFVGPLLYHESPRDPIVYAIVSVVLLIVGLVASAVPASRAARVDPNVALRVD
jgi:putative ABC transport system permease protein